MPKSLNEQIADDVRAHTINLLRFSSSLYITIAEKDLKALEAELLQRLASSSIIGTAELSDFSKKRYQQMLAFTAKTIETVYQELAQKIENELLELADLDNTFFAQTTAGVVGVELLEATLTRAQLQEIVSSPIIQGAPSEEWWKKVGDTQQQKFKTTIRQGMLAGETNDQLIRRVRGTKANGFNDGIFQATYREAEGLVRSSVMSVSNQVRQQSIMSNPDVVKAIMQISTLDSRTSEICMAYSGKRWDMNFKPIGHSLPYNGGCPRHWNCRSTIVPILKTWEDMGIKGLDELSVGTRASMDGQVPADLTFDQWLKAKPVVFQESMLGAGKAKLFREGKITLTELVDQKGRPLTLEQIKKNLTSKRA